MKIVLAIDGSGFSKAAVKALAKNNPLNLLSNISRKRIFDKAGQNLVDIKGPSCYLSSLIPMKPGRSAPEQVGFIVFSIEEDSTYVIRHNEKTCQVMAY